MLMAEMDDDGGLYDDLDNEQADRKPTKAAKLSEEGQSKRSKPKSDNDALKVKYPGSSYFITPASIKEEEMREKAQLQSLKKEVQDLK
jgi:hypothetical protein